MGTYKLNSVGTYITGKYPSSNYYNVSDIRNGWDFDDDNKTSYIYMGYEAPSDFLFQYKKITRILPRKNNLNFNSRYYYRSKYVSYIDPSYDTDTTTSTDDASVAAWAMDSMTARANDFFKSITYNTQENFPNYDSISDTGIEYEQYVSNEDVFNFIINALSNGYTLVLPAGGPGTNKYSKTTYSTVAYSEQWQFKYSHNVKYNSMRLEFEYDDIVPSVTPAYPVNVNVKQTNALTFTWQYTEDQLPTCGSMVGQKAYELVITNTDTGTSTTYSETSSNQFKEFSANTFDVGSYTYTIQVTSNDDIESAVASGAFYVIGPTQAPTIDSVSNDSIPTISWTSTQQDAVEIRISKNGTLLWESGLLAGSSRTSYQLPIMLDNGDYTAELRVLNTFGYYTEYDSYPFTLSPTGPAAATNVRITTTNKYGVNIKADVPTDTTAYVVRRERGSTAEIISKFTGDYTDYYVAGNKAYEYAVRTYETGFTDSDYVSIFVPMAGVVIRDYRDSENFINIYRSDSEFDVNRSDSIASTLVQCLGRPYPIKEMGEWITSIRTVTGHVSEEDYMKLTELALNAEKVYFQSDGEFIVCSMELSYEGRYFAGSGMFVSLTLTRIENELEVEL